MKVLKRLQPSLSVITSHKRERSFSLLIHESKSKRTWLYRSLYIEVVSFRCIATVEQLGSRHNYQCGYTLHA